MGFIFLFTFSFFCDVSLTSDPSLTFHQQQGPDYRLYKSEPELTTVKEEVDEAHGEVKVKEVDEVKVELEGEETAVSEGAELAMINNNNKSNNKNDNTGLFLCSMMDG